MNGMYSSFYLDSPLVPGRGFDLFLPEKPTRKSALFFIHGGGWHAGSRADFHPLMDEFCRRGFICATTDYRMGAGVSAFEQLTDVRLAYERFVSELEARGVAPRIAVHGASAGAHLASLLLCAKPGECGEKVELTRPWIAPECGILQATPVQFTPWDNIFPQIWETMQSVAACARYADVPERFERLSLKHFIRPGNPRLFFMEAACEHVFPTDMTRRLAEAHWKYRIPSWYKIYPDVEHGFFYSLDRKAQRNAFEDFIRFTEE